MHTCTVLYAKSSTLVLNSKHSLYYNIFLPSVVVLPDLAEMYNISCEIGSLSSKMYTNVHEVSLNLSYDQIMDLSCMAKIITAVHTDHNPP